MGKRQRTATVDSYTAYASKPDWYSQMDEHQKTYAKSLRNTPITFCDAHSGTGKTTIATMVGFEAISTPDFQKIVYVRFVDDRYLKQGFLPGTIQEKEQFLFRPFFDACVELDVSEYSLHQLRINGQIEFMTDTVLRGTNIKNSFVIIDEAQNAREIEDLLLPLTRIHTQTCRVAVIGHSGQQDNKKYYKSAKMHYNVFEAFAYHFSKKPWARTVTLATDYRGEISQHADKIWESLEEI